MRHLKKFWIALGSIIGSAVVIVTAFNAFADVPAPVLAIKSLGSNQFSISITNAVTTTNYTLFWTPALADANYPWQVLGIIEIGQTNFDVDAGEWSSGFFQALVGIDSDGDGIPDWRDGDPLNPNVGVLDLTIIHPANGTTFD